MRKGASSIARSSQSPHRAVAYDPAMELIHTCYRITDPEQSIAFYESIGGSRAGEKISQSPAGDRIEAFRYAWPDATTLLASETTT